MCIKCHQNDEVIPSKSGSIEDLITLTNTLTSFSKLKLHSPEKNEKNISESHKLLYTQLTSKECEEICGLTSEILEELSKTINEDSQLIFEFFSICAHGISQRFAGIIFNKNQSTVSRNFNSTLENLQQYLFLNILE